MLLTVLEILAFMIGATLLGAILGWVLRGGANKDDSEVEGLRSKIRSLEKSNRELQDASKSASTHEVRTVSLAGDSDRETRTENKLVTRTAADTPAKTKTRKKKISLKKKASKPATKARRKVASKKTTTRKKTASKKKSVTKKVSKKKVSAALSPADRRAAQAAAKRDVKDIVSRVGKGTGKDDLTKIYGIGPKFQKMLNDMGITSFAQIAKFRKADVRTVAAAIGSFSDRVERDDWVAGAKKAIRESK